MSELNSSELTELRELLLRLQKEITESLASNTKNSQPVELDPAVFGRLSRMDAINLFHN